MRWSQLLHNGSLESPSHKLLLAAAGYLLGGNELHFKPLRTRLGVILKVNLLNKQLEEKSFLLDWLSLWLSHSFRRDGHFFSLVGSQSFLRS